MGGRLRGLADGADGDWYWATQRSEGAAVGSGVWEAKERAILESVWISMD